MSAPPGSPAINWQIGTGTPTNGWGNGVEITGWKDLVAGYTLNQAGSGSNNSYSTATGLITLPQNTTWITSGNVTSIAQPFTVAILWNGSTSGFGNFPYLLQESQATFSFLTFLSATSLQLGQQTLGSLTWTISNPGSTTHSVVAVFNAASSKLAIDGVDQGAAASSSTPASMTGSFGGGNTIKPMGSNPNAGNFLWGSMLVYASDMSASNAAIDTWLKAQPSSASQSMISGILPM